jgi:hypothetical protein
MYDLGAEPATLTAMRPGIDAALTDPATGAPGGTRDDVAQAYGIDIPVSSGALLLFFE